MVVSLGCYVLVVSNNWGVIGGVNMGGLSHVFTNGGILMRQPLPGRDPGADGLNSASKSQL